MATRPVKFDHEQKNREYKRYVVVLAKTGSVIARGTARECAEQMKSASLSTWYSMKTRSDKGIVHKYKFYAEDEYEEKN